MNFDEFLFEVGAEDGEDFEVPLLVFEHGKGEAVSVDVAFFVDIVAAVKDLCF